MINPLIGIHAALGEFAVFAFLWVFVEMFNPNEKSIERAKTAATLGVLLLIGTWFIGGISYIFFYTPDVKPVILAGPDSWAHEIFTETKEHIFLFMPIIAVLALATLNTFGDDIIRNERARIGLMILAGLVVLFGLSMAGMGYLISSGARDALEAGVGLVA